MVGPEKGEQLCRAKNKLKPSEAREDRAGLALTAETGMAGHAPVGKPLQNHHKTITKPSLSASPQPAQGTHI